MQSITGLPFNLTWKAVLAFLFPLLAATGAAGASWIVSGDFSATEIRAAGGGLVASGLALLGAYLGQPGVPVAKANEELDLHDAPGA